MKNTRKILEEVFNERIRQEGLFGQQDHPNGTGGSIFRTLAKANRERCEHSFKIKVGTWENILTEEVYEAYAEKDPEKLRTELVQICAVACAWIEAIDRNLTTQKAERETT